MAKSMFDTVIDKIEEAHDQTMQAGDWEATRDALLTLCEATKSLASLTEAKLLELHNCK